MYTEGQKRLSWDKAAAMGIGQTVRHDIGTAGLDEATAALVETAAREGAERMHAAVIRHLHTDRVL